MPVTSNKTGRRRNQVSLRKEEYELAKKLAVAKGVSMSKVIGEALRAIDSESAGDDPLADLIGKLEDAPPTAAEDHDEVIYNNDSS